MTNTFGNVLGFIILKYLSFKIKRPLVGTYRTSGTIHASSLGVTPVQWQSGDIRDYRALSTGNLIFPVRAELTGRAVWETLDCRVLFDVCPTTPNEVDTQVWKEVVSKG